MRERPRLTDATIAAVLRDHYELTISALTFLPIGNDSASFVYRVDATDSTTYFLKVRANAGFKIPSLAVPHWLHDHAVPHVVAPLVTNTQSLWVSVGDFALSLYPFIDARTAADVGLSEQHWHALGTTLNQIHTSHLPPELLQLMPRETFIPSRRHVLNDLATIITSTTLPNPVQHELAAFWHARRDDIRTVIERADTLGSTLRQAALPLVLCHADLHTWNVLLDAAQQLWIVDWDETLLAPKERDLMFVIGGIGRDLVRTHETASFFEGYGDNAIDPLALVYYRYAWAVQDMGAYAEEVFFSPDRGEETRRDALHGFIDLFEPGNIVTLARESDRAA